MRTLTNILLAAALVAAGSTMGGCLDDENYAACAFAVDYNDECNVSEPEGEEESSQGINCVITEHPQCDDGICVRYQGSSPFCSMACLGDDDCPGGGVCQEFAKGCDESGEHCNHYCVKGNLIQ